MRKVNDLIVEVAVFFTAVDNASVIASEPACLIYRIRLGLLLALGSVKVFVDVSTEYTTYFTPDATA